MSDIEQRLRELELKFQRLADEVIEKTAEELIKRIRRPVDVLDAMALLSLPDHLRKTAIALHRLGGEATADEVAKKTGRARAVESGYLNQLVLLEYLKKERRGRKAYFYGLRKKDEFAQERLIDTPRRPYRRR